MPRCTYPYVMAWGLYMGSNKPYILEQIKLAELERAPIDATYRDAHGIWHTFTQLDNSTTTRSEVAGFARPYLKE